MRNYLLFLSVALLVGAGCAPSSPPPDDVACTLEAKQCPDGSYVGRVPPSCEFAPCPSAPVSETYGTPISFSISSSKTLDDGLKMTLESIDDSRCKPGVQCVWAGELSAAFKVTIGEATQTLRLGQTTAPTAELFDRTFTLGEIDTSSATVTVTK